jgi:hypothetical protein
MASLIKQGWNHHLLVCYIIVMRKCDLLHDNSEHRLSDPPSLLLDSFCQVGEVCRLRLFALIKPLSGSILTCSSLELERLS